MPKRALGHGRTLAAADSERKGRRNRGSREGGEEDARNAHNGAAQGDPSAGDAQKKKSTKRAQPKEHPVDFSSKE